jgi:CBS domain-containing protein
MDNISEIKISHIMTTEIIAANPTNRFSQVFQFFSEKEINHMPVVENGKLLGIISNKDMMKYVYKYIIVQKRSDIAALDAEVKLDDIMTKNIVTAHEDITLAEVKDLFAKAHFNCLPIVNGEDKLVGIVTPKDLMKMKVIHIDGSSYGGY